MAHLNIGNSKPNDLVFHDLQAIKGLETLLAEATKTEPRLFNGFFVRAFISLMCFTIRDQRIANPDKSEIDEWDEWDEITWLESTQPSYQSKENYSLHSLFIYGLSSARTVNPKAVSVYLQIATRLVRCYRRGEQML